MSVNRKARTDGKPITIGRKAWCEQRNKLASPGADVTRVAITDQENHVVTSGRKPFLDTQTRID